MDHDVILQVIKKLISASQLKDGKIADEYAFCETESTSHTCHDMYLLRYPEVASGFTLEFLCEKRLPSCSKKDMVRSVEKLVKELYGSNFVQKIPKSSDRKWD